MRHDNEFLYQRCKDQFAKVSRVLSYGMVDPADIENEMWLILFRWASKYQHCMIITTSRGQVNFFDQEPYFIAYRVAGALRFTPRDPITQEKKQLRIQEKLPTPTPYFSHPLIGAIQRLAVASDGRFTSSDLWAIVAGYPPIGQLATYLLITCGTTQSALKVGSTPADQPTMKRYMRRFKSDLRQLAGIKKGSKEAV